MCYAGTIHRSRMQCWNEGLRDPGVVRTGHESMLPVLLTKSVKYVKHRRR